MMKPTDFTDAATKLEDEALERLLATLQPNAPASIYPAVQFFRDAFACAENLRSVADRREGNAA